jgi:hypothetical protein
MDKKDYSDCLFSYNNQTPEYLPSKLRLPDGSVRRSHYISIEELNTLGYKGPFCVPECCSTDKVTWCCVSGNYVVSCKNNEEIAADNDKFIRAHLQQTLLTSSGIYFDTDLTPEGIKAYENFYGNILYVLQFKNIISEADIPKLELPWNYSYSYMKSLYDTKVNSSFKFWKLTYELCGVDESKCFVETSGFFKIPSDWVLGSGEPYPLNTCPSGHCYDL